MEACSSIYKTIWTKREKLDLRSVSVTSGGGLCRSGYNDKGLKILRTSLSWFSNTISATPEGMALIHLLFLSSFPCDCCSSLNHHNRAGKVSICVDEAPPMVFFIDKTFSWTPPYLGTVGSLLERHDKAKTTVKGRSEQCNTRPFGNVLSLLRASSGNDLLSRDHFTIEHSAPWNIPLTSNRSEQDLGWPYRWRRQ